VGQRQKKGPWGLAGGRAGKPGALLLKASAGSGTRRLEGNWSGRLASGAILRVDTPGGGGYGRT
jgi:N-methylhydantoinase B